MRTTFLGSFSRSQVASAIATGVDYALLFSLVEIAHVWYVLATGLGAFAGALTHFILGRFWSFDATHRHWGPQAYRYALVSAGSLLLNCGGVYLLTGGLGIHYSISVVAMSILVGSAFNFPLHRYYVFR
ncbi:MAG: GtrA family protein [Oligoflexia bacterium]|nr:GtrA family protein [Oligoflexia bacterium]